MYSSFNADHLDTRCGMLSTLFCSVGIDVRLCQLQQRCQSFHAEAGLYFSELRFADSPDISNRFEVS